MSTAKTFIDQIKSGDVTDAINTIKESLDISLKEKINETKLEVLTSYGFVEKKMEDKEEDKEETDSEEKKEESDEDEDGEEAE